MSKQFLPYFNSKSGYYDDLCGGCINYNISNLSAAYNDGYTCSVHGSVGLFSNTRRFAFDDTCSSQRKDRSRSNRDIEKAFDALERKYGRYTPHSDSWWYIATTVCKILGIEEHQKYLDIIASFRTNVLEKDLLYFGDVVSYDIYGRLIANSLNKDEGRECISIILFRDYILPVCNLILDKKYDDAFTLYKEMVLKLKSLYKINELEDYSFNETYQPRNDEYKLVRNKKEEN
ncbi:MAG: hypothetical protein RR189_03145 [Bacilli bacterium]